MKRIQNLVLHPFFFAAAPVLFAYAHNIDVTSALEVLRAGAVVFMVTVLLTVVLRALFNDRHRVGLGISALVLLFFTFGGVYSALSSRFTGMLLARADVLTALWAAAIIVLPWAAMRILPSRAASALTPVLNATGAAALLLSLLDIGIYTVQSAARVPALVTTAQTAGEALVKYDFLDDYNPPEGEVSPRPDIYYIILDGYGRDDVLADLYGIPANPLTEFLREEGFTVAENSHANYGQTLLSLASSLNYHEITDLVDLPPGSPDRNPPVRILQDNGAVRYLRALGYQIVASETGFGFSELKNADVFFTRPSGLTPFESMMLKSSLALVWVDQYAPQMHRDTLLDAFADLEASAEIPGPKFVFMHIVMPHPPFVFDASGGPAAPVSSGDASFYLGSDQSYLEGYRGQLLYTNQLVEKAVRAIFAQSKTPPVIVIQGDHGPGAYADSNWIDRTCLRERFSILNAYYLPGVGPNPPDDITPINTFRWIFNRYFGDTLPILPNRSYYSGWDDPYNLVDVTNRTGECAPLGSAAR